MRLVELAKSFYDHGESARHQPGLIGVAAAIIDAAMSGAEIAGIDESMLDEELLSNGELYEFLEQHGIDFAKVGTVDKPDALIVFGWD